LKKLMNFLIRISRSKVVKYIFGQKIKSIPPLLTMTPGFIHTPSIGIRIAIIIPIIGIIITPITGRRKT